MIKLPQTVFEIEDRFQTAKHWLATKIQSAWRGYVTRKRYIRLKTSVIRCQRLVRCHLQYKRMHRKLEEDNETKTRIIVFVQANVRRLLAVRAYRRIQAATLTIKKY